MDSLSLLGETQCDIPFLCYSSPNSFIFLEDKHYQEKGFFFFLMNKKKKIYNFKRDIEIDIERISSFLKHKEKMTWQSYEKTSERTLKQMKRLSLSESKC
jgi:hypothetical protein